MSPPEISRHPPSRSAPRHGSGFAQRTTQPGSCSVPGIRWLPRQRRQWAFPHERSESGVVVPRHQPFDLVGVKDFLIFQRGQKPGAETNGNSSCGAPLQLMKTSVPNKPGKHQRMNMRMEVEQAAVGLHTEDPDAQAISELQAFTKVFSPGLPCAAQQQFAEYSVATQVSTQQLGDGEGDVPMIQGMNDFPHLLSRYSAVRLSSFFMRRISTCSSDIALCSVESGPNFLILAYKLWVVIPSLPATSATLWPQSTTCLTASTLNSSGYRLLLMFTSLIVILYD